ncbi:MAG: hypothetical protein HOC12_00955 [Euryarchaeota archaeon]|jgi:hypothetical protein|nr:hypothetical protein [Euryarchaeota archaeon]MBT7980072.1 hypothetical protein [Euryarchaeota archaeon]
MKRNNESMKNETSPMFIGKPAISASIRQSGPLIGKKMIINTIPSL